MSAFATVAAKNAPVRTRRRIDAVPSVETPEPVAEAGSNISAVQAEIEALVKEAVATQKASNAASAAYRKAQKALEKKLISEGLEGELYALTINDTVYDYGFVEGEKDEISVEDLRNATDDATFMKIVKATKGETEKVAGSLIAAKVTKTVKADASLKVKERKG